MMREPTSPEVALAWWRLALAGKKPSITHEPQCGFFKRKLVKGGVFVPARIWIEAEIDVDYGELFTDEIIRCQVGGEDRDAAEEWPWLCANPISENEFNFLSADAVWCRINQPLAPEAQPRRSIFPRALPRLF